MASGLHIVVVLCLTSGLWLGADGHCKHRGFSGWSQFEGRWFRFYNTPMTWADAQRFCTRVGGNLAALQNRNMYNFIRQLIFRETFRHTNSWVGGTDAPIEGRWLWIGGERFISVNWARGEPNGGRRENCMDINLRGFHYINDESCHSRRPFVCVKYRP